MLQAVYAEMAVSCAKTILGCFQADTSQTAILVQDMDMQEGLIINESPNPQLVRIVADCVWKEKKVSVEISSIGEKGQMLKLHAKATVAFEDRKGKQQELRQSLSNTGSQIEEMKNNAASGITERFTTSMAYRMVASLAHYDASHKGVKEVYLNSTTLEGCALISSAMKDRLPGYFAIHPCTFDSILQLATFVMNANETSRFDQEVYVVRGWESEYLDGVLSPEDEYETYVKMTAQNADVSVGDIVIMKNNNLFGCIKRVRVQRVPRRLMDVMFRPKSDVSAMSMPPSHSSTAKKEAKGVPSSSMPPNGSSKTEKALSIIAEESGIPKMNSRMKIFSEMWALTPCLSW